MRRLYQICPSAGERATLVYRPRLTYLPSPPSLPPASCPLPLAPLPQCLIQWLQSKKKNLGEDRLPPRCELCGETFQFQDIYAPGAPSRLSLLDVLRELAPRFQSTFNFAVNLFFAILLWGVSFPLYANWWVHVCWCIATDLGDTDCQSMSSPYPTVEKLTMMWYNGLINICVVVASSVVLYELSMFLYWVRVLSTCPAPPP